MKRILYLLIVLSVAFSACSKKGEAGLAATQTTEHTKRKHKKKHKQKKPPKHITYNYVLKSNDYDLKYQKAFEYYNKKKYYKALDLFAQLVPHEKGRARGDEVLFYYAMTNFQLGDYVTSGYYFRNFAYSYPNSEYAEQALFMGAYCYYLITPRWSLDQTTTNDAITQFEIFLSKYPQSNLVDSVNHLIDKLRFKLQKKSYMNAKLYYDLEHYNAADIALNNSLKKYPDSPFKEDAMYYIALSRYQFAQNSVSSKQEERYLKALDAIIEYKNTFPDGKYIAKINDLEEKVNNKLAKIQNNNNYGLQKNKSSDDNRYLRPARPGTRHR